MLRSFVTLAGTALGRARLSRSPVRPVARRPPARRSRSRSSPSNGKVTVSKRPTRIVSLSPTATEIAVRDRRRPAGRRRRRPVRLSEERAEDGALGLHPERRGDRRLPARPRRHRLRPEGPRRARSSGSASPSLHQDGAKSFKGAYQQIRQLGLVTGHDAAAAKLVTGMKTKIAAIAKTAHAGRSGPHASTTS